MIPRSPDRLEAALRAADKAVLIGIGGGGDVVGALATALLCERHDVETVVGGVSWERLPIDPLPGPRTAAEIRDARQLAAGVLVANPTTRTAGGALFAESHMAGFLGDETLLVDPNGGPAAVAEGLGQATEALGADLLIAVDVGGDVLSDGFEPGLGSPLCDAVMLAATARLQRSGLSTIAAIFGPCCDGELTLLELLDRLATVSADGGLLGARAIDNADMDRLEAAVAEVPTEASAQALRCARGEIGQTTIRGGARNLQLSPIGAISFFFDPVVAMKRAAPLAVAVDRASDLEQAHDILTELGVRTELTYERENAPTRASG